MKENQIAEEVRPLEELSDLRTTNTKVFMNDLGEKCACIYPKPVHFLENARIIRIVDFIRHETIKC